MKYVIKISNRDIHTPTIEYVDIFDINEFNKIIVDKWSKKNVDDMIELGGFNEAKNNYDFFHLYTRLRTSGYVNIANNNSICQIYDMKIWNRYTEEIKNINTIELQNRDHLYEFPDTEDSIKLQDESYYSCDNE